MERAHPRGNFHLEFDASHLLQLSANRFFRVNGKQPQILNSVSKSHRHPYRPRSAVTSVGVCSASDVITFGQIWHYLYVSFVAEKDLTNDTQIRVTESIERGIYTKVLRKFERKTRRKISLNYTWLLCGKNFPSQ